MFERVARWEYDHPVRVNLMFGGVVALLSVLTRDWILLLIAAVVVTVRLWGMRPGGYMRRSLERKYGWVEQRP